MTIWDGVRSRGSTAASAQDETLVGLGSAYVDTSGGQSVEDLASQLSSLQSLPF